MKFKVKKSEFNSFIQLIRDVAKTSVHSGFVRLILEDDKLTVYSANGSTMEVYKTFSVSNVNGSGNYCLDYKLLSDRIKMLDSEFFIDIDETSCTMYSNGKNTKLTIDPSQYQDIKEYEYSNNLHVKFGDILEAIEKTRLFASSDTLRSVIMGVLFKINGDSIETVATDSRVLSNYKKEMSTGIEEAEFNIYANELKILNNLFKKEQEITLLINDKLITFMSEDSSFSVRVLNGKYPSYEAIFPKAHEIEIEIDRVKLLSAVNGVGNCTNQLTKLIKIMVKDDFMVIEGDDRGNLTKQDVNCVSTGAITFGLDYKLLETMLKNCENDKVKLEILANNKPIIIRDNNCKMLIMPVLLRD